MSTPVVLSVDEFFEATEEDVGCDIWIIRSPRNMIIATEMRETGRYKSVTVFNRGGSNLETAASLLPTLVEHHPHAEEIVVRGLGTGEREPFVLLVSRQWIGNVSGNAVMLSPA